MDSINLGIKFVKGWETPVEPIPGSDGVSGLDNLDLVGSIAKTGDWMVFAVITMIVLAAACVAGFVFLLRRKQMVTGAHTANSFLSALNLQSMDLRSKICAISTAVIAFSCIVLACFSVCAHGAKVSGTASPLVTDKDIITATVAEDGTITCDTCNIINIDASSKFTIDKSSVSVNTEFSAIDSLKDANFEVFGFDGTVFEGLADASAYAPQNITPLAPSATTSLNFQVCLADPSIVDQLFDAQVFTVSFIPKKGILHHDGLDYYTIEELKEVSKDLEANGSSSIYYSEFNTYMANDEIWWCNSNGQQPATCTAANSTTFDVSKANHDYVCNYTRDNDDTKIDNYPMMRVIGILHDYKAGTTKTTKKKAGLTLQFIHSVHYASQQAQSASCWWGGGSCDVRNKLQSGGVIYDETCSGITDIIQPVDKWYQSGKTPSQGVNIAISQDAMFVPSYSELWNKNENSYFANYSTYNNFTSFDSEGNPKSEGYVYEWAKLHDIDGKSSNAIFAQLGYTNSNSAPIKDDDSGSSSSPLAWERSVSYDNSATTLCIIPGGTVAAGTSSITWSGVTPCFCL